MLSYSIKGKGIIQDLFHDDRWLIEVKDLNSNHICEKVSNLLEAHSEVREQLRKALPSVKANALLAAEDLKELINNRL